LWAVYPQKMASRGLPLDLKRLVDSYVHGPFHTYAFRYELRLARVAWLLRRMRALALLRNWIEMELE